MFRYFMSCCHALRYVIFEVTLHLSVARCIIRFRLVVVLLSLLEKSEDMKSRQSLRAGWALLVERDLES